MWGWNMDDRRGPEVDERRELSIFESGSVHFPSPVARGSVAATIAWILDRTDQFGRGLSRCSITVKNSHGEGTRIEFERSSEGTGDLGGGDEPGVGNSLVADIRRDRGDDGGASIRRIRDTGTVDSDRDTVNERKGGGEGEGEKDDRFSFTDTELRMMCQLFIHGLPTAYAWPNASYWMGDRENRKKATEWLYKTIKDVLYYEGPETS